VLRRSVEVAIRSGCWLKFNPSITLTYENEIVLSKAMMQAMLTTDTTVIRQDCLCYLIEKLEYPV